MVGAGRGSNKRVFQHVFVPVLPHNGKKQPFSYHILLVGAGTVLLLRCHGAALELNILIG